MTPLALGPVAGTEWTILEVYRDGDRGPHKAWRVKVQCSCKIIVEYPKAKFTSLARPRRCQACSMAEKKKWTGYTTKAVRDQHAKEEFARRGKLR